MLDDATFQDLLTRVRRGDQAAAAEVVRHCEPEIRRIIRLRMTDRRLRRVLDSLDICQSVMANFFIRAAAGQFELHTPEQLLKLLAKMAQNKLLNHVERQQAKRRDHRLLRTDGDDVLEGVANAQETPSQIVSARELLEMARRQMTDEERSLADQRADGKEWADIAHEMNSSPEALRKKLTRAMDRVMQNLGLEE